ncbi:MAG: 4-hydroxy-tetrahydrodipicolinate reductase [Dehalococcoidia bacterium]|nr:4-hydroxy-tetrahydrodipicolinate reductase [Chloroflexota bacterium]
MQPVRVLVHGALGRMGQQVLDAVCRDPDLKPVAAVDSRANRDSLQLPDGSGEVPLSADLQSLLQISTPDVMVDFTQHAATMPAARLAARQHTSLVIGTTGLSEADLDEIDKLSRRHGVGAIVAPNFSLGAVLMIHLAKIAARFFDYAEIIEMHHEQKIDAPSGTAITTAKGMIEARGRHFTYPATQKETIPGGRGAELGGIAIHSVRSPGFMAHQEVILGGVGQTLRIRHDQIDRAAFMPGVLLAIKKVVISRGLIFGLDKLLDLGNG